MIHTYILAVLIMGHREGGATCLLCMSDIDTNIQRHADSEFRFFAADIQTGMSQVIMWGRVVVGRWVCDVTCFPLVHIPERINVRCMIGALPVMGHLSFFKRELLVISNYIPQWCVISRFAQLECIIIIAVHLMKWLENEWFWENDHELIV